MLDTKGVPYRSQNPGLAHACGHDAHTAIVVGAGLVLTELFADAYVAQFAHFTEHVRAGTSPSVTGHDARVALEIALAAAESVRTGAPVALAGAVR